LRANKRQKFVIKMMMSITSLIINCFTLLLNLIGELRVVKLCDELFSVASSIVTFSFELKSISRNGQSNARLTSNRVFPR
jgi:hypothetical protein